MQKRDKLQPQCSKNNFTREPHSGVKIYPEIYEGQEEEQEEEESSTYSMHSWRRATCVTRSLDLHLSRRPYTTSRVHQAQKIGISKLLQQNASSDQEVQVNGWIRSVRKQKRIAFAALGDGSTIDSLQAVLKPEQAAE